MGTKRFLIASMLSVVVALPSMAQPDILDIDDDISNFGVWTSIGVEKKINKKFSVGVEGEFRTADVLNEVSRYSIGASVDYKLTSWLKAEVGYVYIAEPQARENKLELKEYKDTDDDGVVDETEYEYKTDAPYVRNRHRVNASLTGSVKFGRFKISLRERWQYTYRPETTTERVEYDLKYQNMMEGFYDGDKYLWKIESMNPEKRQKQIKAKESHMLRSRLQVSYDIKSIPFEPYASIELYNDFDGFKLKKTRYTIGGDYKFNKKHSIGLYYRYQDFSGSDEGESTNILGVGYKFKF